MEPRPCVPPKSKVLFQKRKDNSYLFRQRKGAKPYRFAPFFRIVKPISFASFLLKGKKRRLLGRSRFARIGLRRLAVFFEQHERATAPCAGNLAHLGTRLQKRQRAPRRHKLVCRVALIRNADAADLQKRNGQLGEHGQGGYGAGKRNIERRAIAIVAPRVLRAHMHAGCGNRAASA